jgi:hypothetical protein
MEAIRLTQVDLDAHDEAVDLEAAQAELVMLRKMKQRAIAIRNAEVFSVFDQGARSAALEILGEQRWH